MESLTGVYHAVALLLVVGGLTKVRRPQPLEAMVLAAGRRVPAGTGRLVGLAEVVVGGGAILVGTAPWAAAMSALYLAFTVVVAVAARRGVGTCGCFGAADAPPGPLHVAVDLGAAAVAGFTAADPPGRLGPFLADQEWAGVPHVLLVLVATGLLLVALTDGAAALAEIRSASARRRERRSAPA